MQFLFKTVAVAQPSASHRSYSLSAAAENRVRRTKSCC